MSSYVSYHRYLNAFKNSKIVKAFFQDLDLRKILGTWIVVLARVCSYRQNIIIISEVNVNYYHNFECYSLSQVG